MINRNVLRCVSCDALTLTRTQIGHKALQQHKFPCGTCGIEISFDLELDQKRAGLKYRDPKNAVWVDEDSVHYDHMVYLSDEILVPQGIPEFMSPFIAGFSRYKNFELYRTDEGERQLAVNGLFDYLERCATHFQKGNKKLFDKESQLKGKVTQKLRVSCYYSACSARFFHFTNNTDIELTRVNDRIDRAFTRESALMSRMISELLASGKMLALWTELRSVRRAFVENYASLQPLYQLKYWKEEYRDLASVTLADKRFQTLQQLYIITFETLCRFLVLALGMEVAIATGTLEVPAKKRQLPLQEISSMANATKRDQFSRYRLLADMFVPHLDTDFRNGIGHHSAHYSAETDEIEIGDSKGSGAVISTISYTAFCAKVIDLFSAFELGAMYFQTLHTASGGKFVP